MPKIATSSHAEENLNKVANDRQNALPDSVVDDNIVKVLEDARNRRSEVIIYTGDTEGIPDAESVRLVVLPPGSSLPSRSSEKSDERGPWQRWRFCRTGANRHVSGAIRSSS